MAEQLLLSLHGLLLNLQTYSPSPGHPFLPDPSSSRPFSQSCTGPASLSVWVLLAMSVHPPKLHTQGCPPV